MVKIEEKKVIMEEIYKNILVDPKAGCESSGNNNVTEFCSAAQTFFGLFIMNNSQTTRFILAVLSPFTVRPKPVLVLTG